MQRAEYLADAAAARVAGTAAAIALHERLLLYRTFQDAIQQAALADDARGALDRVRAALRSVPERERERRRRVARLEQTRLEDTHPPTGMRIALLEDRAPLPPAVTLSRVRRRPGSTPSSSRSRPRPAARSSTATAPHCTTASPSGAPC